MHVLNAVVGTDPEVLILASRHEDAIAGPMPIGPDRTFHEMASTLFKVAAHMSRHVQAMREADGHV